MGGTSFLFGKNAAHPPFSLPPVNRAELKVTDLKVTEPNLRFPVVFCEKSAVFLPALQVLAIFKEKGVSLRKSAVFLRKSAFRALSVTLVPSP